MGRKTIVALRIAACIHSPKSGWLWTRLRTPGCCSDREVNCPEPAVTDGNRPTRDLMRCLAIKFSVTFDGTGSLR